MHLPATVGDYTDFYVGINHAVTVGELSGRTTRCCRTTNGCPSATTAGPARRFSPAANRSAGPTGSGKTPADAAPTFGPSANWTSNSNSASGSAPATRRDPIPIGEAADHVAGYCLLNDWSARDIQSWEYQPLGPFLSKNFATTISAWVVTPEALAPYRSAAPTRPDGDPAPLAYLDDPADQASGGLDIDLEVLHHHPADAE